MDGSGAAAPLPHHQPVLLAGEANDAKLRSAAALSREEVLLRRRRRLLQLLSLYKSQYWALADELPAKQGEYWWAHGTTPLADVPPPTLHGEHGVPAAAATPSGGARAVCAALKCESKAMPLSAYCFHHILLDPRQQLYKPCTYVTRQSSTQNGKTTCGKPVLRGITPLQCAGHVSKAQEKILIALEKAGVDLPSKIKTVPKFSVLLSQCVRQIQMKRKLSLKGPNRALSCRSLI